MGSRGWVGPFTPVDEGGSGLGVAEYCLIEEEVGRLGLVSPQISIQGQRWLIDWATPEQRERYLPGIARGTLIFSESISEPGVGSSMKLMRTTAERDGDDWIINGDKTHVNLGCESQVTLVYAIAPEGITAFLVDTDLPGVSTTHTDPIGLRLIPTADVTLDNVRVPGSAVLGEAGRGMDTFFSTFNMSRLGNASELIGFGRRALADAIAYGSGREVGDSVVTDFQGIQWTVADCYSDLYGASLARDHAANLHDAGGDVALATTLAKKMAISGVRARRQRGVRPDRGPRPLHRHRLRPAAARHEGAAGGGRLAGGAAQLRGPPGVASRRLRGPGLTPKRRRRAELAAECTPSVHNAANSGGG